MSRVLAGTGETSVDPQQIREDKFRVPRLGEEILSRIRIRDLISDSVHKRVTVITGPAGAGKTIACASWAAHPGSRRIVWLSLDEGDRDQERFWANLGIAARAGRDQAPLSPLVPRSRSGADRPAVAMEDTLRALGGPAVLILDDVHELAGSAALHDLNFLLGHAPDTVRIVLSGRWLAGSHVARLRLSGDLAEIGAADLACTAGEAAQYLARIGATGTEADRAGLLAYTRGWMGGLKLVALDGPSGSAMADYLRDEVLDGLSPQDRLILLRTSVASAVTEDLAESLCDEPGAGASLGRVSQLTGLAEPAEDGHYSLSPLLRDTLLAELRRERPREVPRLFGRAARWYAARGDAVDSVRCAVEAGDWEFASRLLADGGFFAELPGRAAELERLLGEFPAGRRTADPAVAGAFAAARLCADDPETASVWLTCAAQRPPDARLPTLAWLAALRVMLTGADTESKRIAESAPDGGPPAQQAAIGLLWFALGAAASRDGDLREARNAFSDAEHRFHVGMPELVGRVRGWQALTQARRGDLTAADRLIGELRGGGPGSDAGPAVACLTALATAHVALERDDTMTAAAAVGQADLAAAAWLPGEPDAAAIHEWLRVRLRLPATDMAPDPAHPLTRARALLGGGDADGALALASEFLGDDAQASGPRELITARLVAAVASRARGDSVTAARLLEQALAAAAPHGAYLPFLEGGTALRTAISVLIPPTSDVASFAARVLARFQAQPSDAEPATDGPAPALTDSELAVLRLLPAYLTNQEIAEALFLSVNTVKTHLRIAYRKLGVTSRRAAIAQGRRLGVL